MDDFARSMIPIILPLVFTGIVAILAVLIFKKIVSKFNMANMTEEDIKKMNERHKCLTYGTAIGIVCGAAVGTILQIFIGISAYMYAPAVGLLVGAAIGMVIDSERAKK